MSEQALSGDLAFPDNAGCAGVRHRVGGTPGLCLAQPVLTVVQRLEHPRPKTVRLFVCEAHAVGQTDPRALTVHDRAELRRRRASATTSAAATGRGRRRA
ncbi:MULTISPECIES: hypothetical protein [unclassified Pseudonocardia]|jgi:hypothetical protein|uniref:hypothetical protein n=1 Tax=unclassified Pseudonocardia TaxID=2619320 RepID=UPI000964E632|nr:MULTISPECIES: hypothetical protein [unclassified Pseudonocardia]MBN9099271.1 hypothetical protein [Pseudonocardia sp.]OJY49639.1 MAG: hypothetical protein BGP03_18505 [Pseudonocardia sp. 73-21]